MEPFAEAIWQNPLIQGITTADYVHKIGLFEDDVLLTLTNVASSLRVVQDEIDKFGMISYYKVNIKKSSILPIKITKSAIKPLKREYPYSWDNNSIDYLGIKLTSPVSKLYDTNFPLLY